MPIFLFLPSLANAIRSEAFTRIGTALFFSDPARISTLILTGLMVIGLGFFIRASTKDRIETMQFGAKQPVEALEPALMRYFQSRAFAPPEVRGLAPTLEAKTAGTTTLVGLVSPSSFLAVFLSLLAAVGFASFTLIMSTLFPAWGKFLIGLVALSPLAGGFYWRKSSRPETVIFKVESEQAQGFLSKLTIKGHRDEIADLQNAFAEAGMRKWEVE